MRSAGPGILTLALGACLAGAAAAQTPAYTDVTASRLPAGLAGRCMDAAAGDADGDGGLDLALALGPAAARGFDVEVADFDADGVTDLFLCNRASSGEPGAAASGGLQRLLLGVREEDQRVARGSANAPWDAGAPALSSPSRGARSPPR